MRTRKTLPPGNILSCRSTSQRRPVRECCFIGCFVCTVAPVADPLPRISWPKARIYIYENIPNGERDAANPECRRERSAKVASSVAQTETFAHCRTMS